MSTKQELLKQLRAIERKEKANAEAIGRMFVKAGMNRFQAQALLDMYQAWSNADKEIVNGTAREIELRHKAEFMPKVEKMRAGKEAKKKV